MPEEDGYSMISRIRQMPVSEGGAIPAIALSAFTTIESKQKAFECGFQLYSTKPFEPEKLVSDILQLTAQSLLNRASMTPLTLVPSRAVSRRIGFDLGFRGLRSQATSRLL